MQAVEACRSEPRDTWLHRHGHWGKWMVLRVAGAHVGLTLAQPGEAIGGRDYAAVGMGLKTLDRKLRTNKSLQRTHLQVLQLLHLEMCLLCPMPLKLVSVEAVLTIREALTR